MTIPILTHAPKVREYKYTNLVVEHYNNNYQHLKTDVNFDEKFYIDPLA